MMKIYAKAKTLLVLLAAGAHFGANTLILSRNRYDHGKAEARLWRGSAAGPTLLPVERRVLSPEVR